MTGGPISGENIFTYQGEFYRPALPNCLVFRNGAWEASEVPNPGQLYGAPAENADQIAAVVTAESDYKIKLWDGVAWRELGIFGEPVFALAWFRGELHVGGAFVATPDGAPAHRIARWNGSSWFPLAAGLDGDATSFAPTTHKLYVGGYFQNADGLPSRSLAAWNGQSWEQFDANPNGAIYRMGCSPSGALAVVGAFRYVGLRALTKLLSGVAEKLGRELNPHTMTREEFSVRRRKKDHFLSNVLASPRLFVKGTEREFGAMEA